MAVAVEGRCHERFSTVRDAFTACLGEPDELGGAVAVVVDGETVVDLWGGWADLERTRPWAADTLVDVYSVGKPIVALLVLQLVDRGLIDLDDPVAEVWPDFAAGGKESATIRHALSHRAGVPAIREPLTNEDLWDFDRMCAALAATEPWSEPGSRLVYHTNTFGHLAGGIVRAVTGEGPGERLSAVAGPIGADVHFGVADADLGRCADVLWSGPARMAPNTDPGDLSDEQRMVLLGYSNPPGYSSMGVVNTPEWRRAQVPSTNGHMTALGVARIYAALLDGSLLDGEVLAEATRSQSEGLCPVLGQEVTFGLGFQPWTESRPMGRRRGAFGHYGTGGSLGFADPGPGIAFGYVANHVIPRWRSPVNAALVDAVYASL